MAFKVSSEAQVVFFDKVFGATAPTTNRAKALVGNGVTFEVSLYTLVAKDAKGKASSLSLTVGSSALMKGTVDPMIATQNKSLIEGWIAGLYQEQGSPTIWSEPKILPSVSALPTKVVLIGTTHVLPNLLTLIKAVFKAQAGSMTPELTLAESKTLVETVLGGVPRVVGVYPTLESANMIAQTITAAEGKVELVMVELGADKPVTTAKPVNAVIDLKNAAALGQKVHGTSEGSVYHTVALTDHVKVAARLYKSGSIAIRAEWTGNPQDELKKLQESGLQMKAHYGSIHFDAAGVPLPRVIGAFLVGTGINWKAIVMNGAELVIGEKP